MYGKNDSFCRRDPLQQGATGLSASVCGGRHTRSDWRDDGKPVFEVNRALISRSIIFELKPLEKREDIEKLLERAVTDPGKGARDVQRCARCGCKEFLADIAGGDARAALNAIELGVLSTERQADGKIHIDLETASSASRSASCGTTRRAISITIRSLHLSRACAVLTRMRRSFIWPKCCMPGGGYQVYRPPHHDLRGGGCRPCRSECLKCSSFRVPCRGTRRHAGGADYSGGGSHVCCLCTEE